VRILVGCQSPATTLLIEHQSDLLGPQLETVEALSDLVVCRHGALGYLNAAEVRATFVPRGRGVFICDTKDADFLRPEVGWVHSHEVVWVPPPLPDGVGIDGEVRCASVCTHGPLDGPVESCARLLLAELEVASLKLAALPAYARELAVYLDLPWRQAIDTARAATQ
jgi:hypothetical protein